MLRVLQQASQRAARELADQPDARTEVELTLGRTLIALSDYPQAVAHLRTAQALAQQSAGAGSTPALEAASMLGQALSGAGQAREAERVLRAGMAQAARGNAKQQSLGNDMRARLAWALRDQGRMLEALAESRHAYVAALANVATTAERRIDAGNSYAGMLAENGQLAPAIACSAAAARAHWRAWARASAGAVDAQQPGGIFADAARFCRCRSRTRPAAAHYPQAVRRRRRRYLDGGRQSRRHLASARQAGRSRPALPRCDGARTRRLRRRCASHDHLPQPPCLLVAGCRAGAGIIGRTARLPGLVLARVGSCASTDRRDPARHVRGRAQAWPDRRCIATTRSRRCRC